MTLYVENIYICNNEKKNLIHSQSVDTASAPTDRSVPPKIEDDVWIIRDEHFPDGIQVEDDSYYLNINYSPVNKTEEKAKKLPSKTKSFIKKYRIVSDASNGMFRVEYRKGLLRQYKHVATVSTIKEGMIFIESHRVNVVNEKVVYDE